MVLPCLLQTGRRRRRAAAAAAGLVVAAAAGSGCRRKGRASGLEAGRWWCCRQKGCWFAWMVVHWLELARRVEADSKRFRCGRITHQQNSIMKGTHVMSRLGDGGGKGNVDAWTWTWTKTGHIHGSRLRTYVMYKATKHMCRTAAAQAQYALYVRWGERGSQGRKTHREKWREREGTHNRLAAPVLMLRPAGPLADLAKAIVDRAAASLLRACSPLPLCVSACLPASERVCAGMAGDMRHG